MSVTERTSGMSVEIIAKVSTPVYLFKDCVLFMSSPPCKTQPVSRKIQDGSNMTGTNCDLFTHKSSRSYLNHLVFWRILVACRYTVLRRCVLFGGEFLRGKKWVLPSEIYVICFTCLCFILVHCVDCWGSYASNLSSDWVFLRRDSNSKVI
jgi:hypothetical protein